MSRILIVAAHPDDEVLGCAGTVAKFIKEGCEAYTIILGEGVTSRDGHRDRSKRETEINELKAEINNANNLMGIKNIYTFDFPDNRFDSVDLLDIIKTIENVKKEVKPDIIFTHYEHDLNIDHTITFRAVMTATRPLIDESVKEIYSFEVLSSTEWNFPCGFDPNLFCDISDTINSKLNAIKCYKNELKLFPHPRSLEAIIKNAETWGFKIGRKYVEPFKTIRIIR